MEKRCDHSLGWCSSEPGTTPYFAIWENGGQQHVSVNIGRGPSNRLVMRCNRTTCRAIRNAYFDKHTGAFVKFGKVRYV